ncbi:MAG: TldD/PmbA family protein [Gemmatimonadales bacterium]
MKERILEAIERSRAGFSELRLRRVWTTTILVRGRSVESAGTAVRTGGLARCCSSGTGWGAVGFIETGDLEGRLLRAHELSLAGCSREPVQLATIPIRQHDSAGSPADDPREVLLSTKRDWATRLGANLLDLDRRIGSGRVLAEDEVVETWLGTSEGTWVHDVGSRVRIAVLAIARQEGSIERALGSVTAGGWGDLAAAASLVERVGARAVERLEAAPVRAGCYPVVLDPAAAGALLHRALAHLARPALPGADPDVLPVGARIGPDCLTVGDDPTAPGLAASSSYDDEGTYARRCTIVQNGVVLGHLHTRETAGASGQAPTGHARASSLDGLPYPRATNSFLAPGKGSLDDLLDGIGLGVYVADALGCEASDQGVAFRAGAARMIRAGRLGEPVKGVRLGGELLDVLGRVELVAGDFRWETAASRCRDGAAGTVTVTTGAPHVRLREIDIASEVG